MSAIRQKADIGSAKCGVGYGPQADIDRVKLIVG